jgi:hypothetical protein
MARGSQKRSNNNFHKVFCQIKGLAKGDNIRIEMNEPDEEGNDNITYEQSVEGKLVAIKDASYEYEGETVPQFMLIMEDADAEEVYFVKCNMNSIGRQIINSLAGTNDIGTVEISVWNDKESGYTKCYVTNNGERTEWGWHPRDDEEWTSKIIQNTVKKKVKGKMTEITEKDYYDLNEWLLNDILLGEVKKKLPKSSPKPTAKKGEEEKTQEYSHMNDELDQQDTPSGEEGEEDAPF